MRKVGLFWGGLILFALFIMILSLSIGVYAVNYSTLQEYEDSINYSCQNDNDCVIKDVHKCCGFDYYCVNSNALVDSDFVKNACEREGITSTCDIHMVDYCKCEDNKCVGKQGDPNSGCKTYYYFDNENKNCDAKEFCGAFMYYGLQTFGTKEECLNALNETCIEKNNSCCKGNKCSSVLPFITCETGTIIVSGGCNEDCALKFECISYNQSAVCTQDCPEVCCNLRGIHVTKCNRCICEKQYGGVVIGDKKCDKTPSREELKKEIERLKKEREELKRDIKELRGDVKEIMKKYNGWMNITDRNITIHELSDDRKEIIANKINARTGLNLTAEDINNETVLRAYLSNGRFAEIKIMPDKVSEIALAVLRAKCEIRNCTLELKEVGIGNKTRLAYAIETEKQSRLFFIFKNKMIIRAQVDAETGEIISVKKPWWAFMAKEEDD